MKTVDEQVMKVSVDNFNIGPTEPTIDLPDRFIPVKGPSDLADAIEKNLETAPPAEQMFGLMQLTRAEGQIIISASVPGSSQCSTYALDDSNARELIDELRKAADSTFNSCLISFSK